MKRLLLNTLLFLILAGGAFAEETAFVREGRIKSAILYHLANGILGEVSQSASFTICLLGNDPLDAFIAMTVARKTIAGRVLAVHRPEPGAIQNCDILFLGDMPETLSRTTLSHAVKLGIPTVVNDHRGGALVAVYRHDNRLQLRVNLKAVKELGFTLTRELLEVGWGSG